MSLMPVFKKADGKLILTSFTKALSGELREVYLRNSLGFFKERGACFFPRLQVRGSGFYCRLG